MCVQSSKKVPLFFKSLDKDCPIEVTKMLLEHLTPVGLEERDSVGVLTGIIIKNNGFLP